MKYYFFAILNDIICLFVLLGLGGFLSAWIFGMFYNNCCTDEESKYKKGIKYSIVVGTICFLLSIFIPSQKQLAFIIAAPYILENQELKDASKNTSEIIKLGTEYIKTVLELNAKIEKDK